MRLTAGRLVGALAACAVLGAVVAAVAVIVGATAIDTRELAGAVGDPALRADSTAYHIVFEQRIPRVILGLLVGLGLGIAGAALQAVLRNPLADPYVLGISTGSAVGAVIGISLGASFTWGPFRGVQVFALAGAVAVSLLLFRLAARRSEFSMNALLLCGVTFAIIGSAAILFLRYLAEPRLLAVMDRWMMGGLAVVGYDEVLGTAPLLFAGVGVLLWLAGPLNHVALDEELAAGRGVDVDLVQRWSFAATSLITAAVVSTAGPIGFVGLIVPHAVRRIVGSDLRLVLPCSGLVAGAFLVLCDTLARTIVAPTELPVGIITALIGGPVFVARDADG
jgi:iron complex transport system permease protein